MKPFPVPHGATRGKQRNTKMKKQLIAFCAFALAATVQAASYAWSGSEIYQDWGDPDSENYAAGTAYLFIVDVNEVTAANLNAAVSGGTFVSDGWVSKAVSSAELGSNTGAFSGTYNSTTDYEGKNMYAVVLATGYYDGDTATTATGVDPAYIIMSNVQTAGAQPALGSAAVDFGGFYTQGLGGPSGWTTVPEPCSVALLLLGATAFGLKRKRA